MTGLIRKDQLLNGDALDRRRIWESFMEAAERLSEISSFAIGDGILGRENFELNSWIEMYTSHSQSQNFVAPDYGSVVSDSMIEVVHDDSFFEGRICWAIDLRPGDAGKLAFAYPVVDGIPIYGALDFMMVDQLIEYIYIYGATAVDPDNEVTQAASASFVNTYNSSLGGEAHVQGLNGRSSVVIMVRSIGEFVINKCDISLKKVLR